MKVIIAEYSPAWPALFEQEKELLKAENVAESTTQEIEKDIERLQTITDRFSKIGSEPKLENLDIFSIKFYNVLLNINNLVINKDGNKTAFLYSNLVKVGVDLFKNILIQWSRSISATIFLCFNSDVVEK